MLVMALFIFCPDAFGQLPCDCAQRWTGGGHWNTDGTINELPNAPLARGVIRCASAAETQSQVVPKPGCVWNSTQMEAFGITLPFGEVCFDPSFGPESTPIQLQLPTEGQPVIWFNFDVRAYISSFSFQLNDNSGDILGWALYGSNDAGPGVDFYPSAGDSLSGNLNCSSSNLTLLDFGDGSMRRWCGSESSNTWSTPTSPESFDPLQPGNFYLLIWDQQGTDNNVEVNNFKARFGCGDPTICFLEAEEPEIECNAGSGTYTVTVPIIGNNGQYVGTDPNATPTTSAPVCLTNLGSTGVITGNIVMTYPLGVDYNITIAPVVPATDGCATPDNPSQCDTTITGTAPFVDLDVDFTHVTCAGEEDGTISATASAGATITVDGSPYDPSAEYGAGSYEVCAVSGDGCQACETVVIGEPAEVTLTVSSTDVTCFGEEDGTITASGGTSITVDGAPYDASATYGPGSYLVCASAEGGNPGDVCTDCETVVIGEPAEVILTVSSTDASCNGEEDGTITASGGTSITVDGAPYDASATYGPGSYLVCASAAGGNPGDVCTDCETVVIGEPGEVVLTVSSTDVTCFGEEDGTITASGGTSITVDGAPYDASATYGSGSYLVCASAEGGNPGDVCTDCETVVIGDGPEVVLTVESTDETCAFSNNGSITASATLGASISVDGAPYVSGTAYAPGSYEVCATVPGTVCEDCETVTIGAATALTLDIEVECVGGSGTATAIVTGGTGNYDYLWSTGATTVSVSGLPNGQHWVMATDENGCFVKDVFDVDCFVPCDFRTQTQGGWGAKPKGGNPGAYLHANFSAAFPMGVEIGCGGRRLRLTSAMAVTNFLPSGGQPNILPLGMMVNPTNYNNTLAGQLVALKLSVGFDSYDPNFGSSDGLLAAAYVAWGPFAGMTIAEVLEIADQRIGACGSMNYSISQLNQVLTSINENFVDGTTNNGFIVCTPPTASRKNLVIEEVVTGFEAFPNPVRDMLSIRIEHAANADVIIDLFDISGRNIKQIAAYEAKAGDQRLLNVTVNDLLPGVYILSLQENGHRTIKRIAVER